MIQKADRRARSRALALIGVATLAGASAILLLQHYRPMLENWVVSDPTQTLSRLKVVFLVLTALIAAPPLGFSVYFWRLGKRIVLSERFPPAGVAVVRDTPVLRGQAARKQGRLLQAVSGVFALLACAVPVLFWYLFQHVAA